MVKVVGGYAFRSEDFSSEGVAVVRISNLAGDGIDLGSVARIPKERLGKGVTFKIRPGDILIAMTGSLGKIGVVPTNLTEDVYQNQRVGNCQIRDGARIHHAFLLSLLQSQFYQRFLRRLATGVAQANVSGSQLESAVIPLPPMELQQRFARHVATVEKTQRMHGVSSAELECLFRSLQHRAFAGEL